MLRLGITACLTFCLSIHAVALGPATQPAASSDPRLIPHSVLSAQISQRLRSQGFVVTPPMAGTIESLSAALYRFQMLEFNLVQPMTVRERTMEEAKREYITSLASLLYMMKDQGSWWLRRYGVNKRALEGIIQLSDSAAPTSMLKVKIALKHPHVYQEIAKFVSDNKEQLLYRDRLKLGSLSWFYQHLVGQGISGLGSTIAMTVYFFAVSLGYLETFFSDVPLEDFGIVSVSSYVIGIATGAVIGQYRARAKITPLAKALQLLKPREWRSKIVCDNVLTSDQAVEEQLALPLTGTK